jgi:hypothetical protein
MSIPFSPPQDVPVRRSSEELAYSSHGPLHGAPRSSFRGLNRGDGILASPREVVGNIMSSNLGGSPLSRAGYDNKRNYVLSPAHSNIPRLGSFNTAITFIQLPPRLDRVPYLIRRMILEHARCSCRTWLFLQNLQKQATPHRCQRPRLMNSRLAAVRTPKPQGCLPLCLSTSFLLGTYLPRSSLCGLKLPTRI